MERFWLKDYPPGVPADIDPAAYPTLVSLLEESFAKYRNDKAYVCMDEALTFGEIDMLSQALALWQGSPYGIFADTGMGTGHYEDSVIRASSQPG